MTPGHGRPLAAAILIAAASAGCGFGAGEGSEGVATLTVTRDYGAEVLVDTSEEDPPGSETVIRFLDREAEISTRYGGGFVQSIEGVSGEVVAGRSRDWFFYVNGLESSVGAAEVDVAGGDRVWWDYRDWTDAMRVPGVVGSWPEPFLQASADGEREAVPVECATLQRICASVAGRLAESGADATVERFAAGSSTSAPRVLVGPWRAIEADDAASLLGEGPATSGVFARFEGDGTLAALDQRARVADALGSGSGLVAALRDGERPPTWLVTGVDPAGVEAAAGLLEPASLEHRYAVATDGAEALALPVPEAAG